VVIAVNNKAEGSAPLSCVELAREIIEAYARLAHEHEHDHDDTQAAPEAEPQSDPSERDEDAEPGSQN
jgi:ribosomal protein S2